MLAKTYSLVCWRTVALILMVVSTLVRFFKASPMRSSVSCREESSVLLPCHLIGGMRERMLNPVLSLAFAKTW